MVAISHLDRMKDPDYRRLMVKVQSLVRDFLPDSTQHDVSRDNHMGISLPFVAVTATHLAVVMHPHEEQVEVGLHYEKPADREANKEALELLSRTIKNRSLPFGRNLEFLEGWRDNRSQGWTKAMVKIPFRSGDTLLEVRRNLLLLYGIAAAVVGEARLQGIGCQTDLAPK